MTTPQVGVTHDVVIYASFGNVGLIVRGGSYRVGNAPTFIPRMAMGDPKGTDEDVWTSWSQDDWRGGVQKNRPVKGMESCNWANDLYGLMPDRERGELVFTVNAVVGSADAYVSGGNLPPYFTFVNGVAGGDGTGMGHRALAADKIFWFNWVDPSDPWTYSKKNWGGYYSLIHTRPSGHRLWQAVVYSGVMFASEYYSSGNEYLPYPIIAHENTIVYTPACATTAGALAVYDNKLWRAEFLGSKIAYHDPTAQPVCISSQGNSCYGYRPALQWSEWIETAPNEVIKQMRPFVGRLMIGTTSALWAYEAGRTYKVVDFASQADVDNFNVMETTHGALWFNIKDRLYRYTTGGLLEEMAWRPDPNTEPRYLTGAGAPGGLLIGNLNRLDYIDAQTGAVVPVLRGALGQYVRIGAPGYIGGKRRQTKDDFWDFRWNLSHWVCLPSDHNNYSGYFPVLFNDPTRIPQPDGDVSEHSIGWTDPDYHYVEMAGVCLGYPALKKTWREIAITHAFGCSVLFKVYTSPTGSNYSLAGEVGGQAGRLVLPLSIPNSEWLYVKIKVGHPSLTPSEHGIQRVEIRASYVPSGKKRIQFNAIVTDDLELLNMTVENSAAYVMTSLYSLASGGIHTVAVPFPPPVGHTFQARVELGPTGAVVPVLGYDTPSGCPGADVAITLTEV